MLQICQFEDCYFLKNEKVRAFDKPVTFAPEYEEAYESGILAGWDNGIGPEIL